MCPWSPILVQSPSSSSRRQGRRTERLDDAAARWHTLPWSYHDNQSPARARGPVVMEAAARHPLFSLGPEKGRAALEGSRRAR
jgi:hypothetical protein